MVTHTWQLKTDLAVTKELKNRNKEDDVLHDFAGTMICSQGQNMKYEKKFSV